ncbi:DegV family protein [Paratractidigestivibacter sp.]|uniref:DegV family protein n=1 Tax=Paratractidigestivibacter sp. TaxID=2847316 RepID=UPI002ABE4DC5|nr:DegV family protein [Paratractidigestivibacter sp.]
MPGYVLSCCSTVDLTRDWLDGRDIKYVYFNYVLDGVSCKDDFGQTNSPSDLYAKMLAGADAKTSQVSTGDYVEHFEQFLAAGLDVVHVTLSSGISGTYNSAVAAKGILAEKYPERKLIVVDSLCASAGYGLLVDRLADLRDQGMGAEELGAWAEDHKLEVQHWFFSSDLTFFIRGGRISKAAGLIGGMLKICPVMDVEPDGSLAVKEKIRNKKNTIKRDLQIMEELAVRGVDYADKVFISQADCEDDAREVASQVEAKFTKMDGPVHLFPIGATIGCHTGPGTVALFFWGKPRA